MMTVLSTPQLIDNIYSRLSTDDRRSAADAIYALFNDRFTWNKNKWTKKVATAYDHIELSVVTRPDGTFALLYNGVVYNSVSFGKRHAANVAKAAVEAPSVPLRCSKVTLAPDSAKWVRYLMANPLDAALHSLIGGASELTVSMDNLEAWYDYAGPLQGGRLAFRPLCSLFPGMTRLNYTDTDFEEVAVAWNGREEEERDIRVSMLMEEYGIHRGHIVMASVTYVSFADLPMLQGLACVIDDQDKGRIPPRYPAATSVEIAYLNMDLLEFSFLLRDLGHSYHLPAVDTIYLPATLYASVAALPEFVEFATGEFGNQMVGTETRSSHYGNEFRVTKRFIGSITMVRTWTVRCCSDK